jgi:Tryptophan-associated transmembrane protein (Trp_oprn_chp)
MADLRRTFGPVVLAGLASAGLAAWAGGQDWATFDQDADPASGSGAYQSAIAVGVSSLPSAPLVSALAFAVLAAWGVLLVTRGRFRRGAAVLTALASLAMLVAAVVALASSTETLAEPLVEAGLAAQVERTPWPYVAVAAGVLSLVAGIAAVRLVPWWPEMGSRYDAPGSGPPPSDASSLDLWRALDEGRDPTLPETRRTDP